jgi:hypothetical protein
MDARTPQGLVRVDVPQTCEKPLVEQERLDASTPPGEKAAKRRGSESIVERLRSEGASEVVDPVDQPQAPKLAHIVEA